MASVLKVNEIQHTSGTSAITIDSNGNVNFPVKPAFYVTRSASYGPTTARQQIEFDVEQIDTHNAWSTSSFDYTIPVAGLWYFNLTISMTSLASTYLWFGGEIYVNGGLYTDLYTNSNIGSGSGYENVNIITMRECVVGDVFTFNTQGVSTGYLVNHDGKRTKALGYLIG